MQKKTSLFILFSFLIVISSLAQTNNYYFKGQSKAVYFSNRIIFIHFVPNLTNSQKQDIISNAQLDLLSANSSAIPDYVKLQSRVTTGWHWVYPCVAEAKQAPNIKKDTVKADPNIVPLPCEGCPDCTPRYEYYEYNNFDNSLYFLSTNINVRSVSKGFSAISNSSSINTGTEENFYIKIKTGYTINDFNSLLTAYNLSFQDVSIYFGTATYKISMTREESKYSFDRANAFYNTGMCEYSTPNFLEIGSVSNSNDPRWPDQWGLSNTGQFNGTPGADIRIENAWAFSKGGNVKVAVLDDGCLVNHADLAPNLLTSYNFSSSPYIDGWHGAQVAGVLGAVANNNIDITGVAPESKMIPIKIFTGADDASNIALYDQIAKGINLAYTDGGAEVLNCSWGTDFESDLIDKAVTNAITFGRNGKGCVVVFSIGNENNTKNKYPAATHLGVISVGAMTHCNSRKSPSSCDPNSGFSDPSFLNWGSNFGNNLSIMAPGVRIPTITLPSYVYTNITGTSAAAPMVSGVAALILSINPNLTQQEVRRIIELGSNKVGNYCYNWTSDHPNGPWHPEMGYGRLNAYNAAQLARPGVTISNPTYNVTAQSCNAVTGNISMIFNGTACPINLPIGINYVKRYEVLSNITYPYTPNPVIICSSNGFSQANPNTGSRWAEAINVTNTSATLRTYIYVGYNSVGQEIGWIPTTMNNIKFNYVVVGSPVGVIFQQSRSSQDTILDAIRNAPFTLDLKEDITINDIPFDITKGSISPNPVQKILNLKIVADINKIENIEIYNSTGIKVKLIANKRINKGLNSISIDVSNLTNSSYILKCGALTYKFIKVN